MTTPDITTRLRESAEAFRKHPIHDSEGDPALLLVQANECEEAALEIEHLRLASAWQPIETAPKDGTQFVGWNGKCAFKTHLGQYYDKWPHQEGGPTYIDRWNAEDAYSVWPWSPTHWMPLPATPSQIEEGGNV